MWPGGSPPACPTVRIAAAIDDPGASWTGFRLSARRRARRLSPRGAAGTRRTRGGPAGGDRTRRRAGRAGARPGRAGAQLDHLLATARRVAESLDLDTVLTSIVDGCDGAARRRQRRHAAVGSRARRAARRRGRQLPAGHAGLRAGVRRGRCRRRRSSPSGRSRSTDYETYEHRATALDQYDFGAVLCAPLIFRGTAIGAINVHARAGQRGFAGRRRGPPGRVRRSCRDRHRPCAPVRERGPARARPGRDEPGPDPLADRPAATRRAGPRSMPGRPGSPTVLAEHLDRRVVIQDHLHRLIAGAAPDGATGWRRAARSRTGPAIRTARRSLRRRGPGRPEVVGHLLLSSDADLGPTDRALVDVATTGRRARVRQGAGRRRGGGAAAWRGGHGPADRLLPRARTRSRRGRPGSATTWASRAT